MPFARKIEEASVWLSHEKDPAQGEAWSHLCLCTKEDGWLEVWFGMFDGTKRFKWFWHVLQEMQDRLLHIEAPGVQNHTVGRCLCSLLRTQRVLGSSRPPFQQHAGRFQEVRKSSPWIRYHLRLFPHSHLSLAADFAPGNEMFSRVFVPIKAWPKKLIMKQPVFSMGNAGNAATFEPMWLVLFRQATTHRRSWEGQASLREKPWRCPA